jgi:hypothetical protein
MKRGSPFVLKAITLWRPWALFVANGRKRIEVKRWKNGAN